MKFIHDYRYHIDKTNRCVVCWMTTDSLVYTIENSLNIDWIPYATIPYTKEAVEIKTVARAKPDESWNPELLKTVARMKAERHFDKLIFNILYVIWDNIERCQRTVNKEMTCYSSRAIDIDNRLSDDEFYERLRVKYENHL